MKKPILILHGWGLRGEKYRALQRLLEKKGYRVFTPDFPGFGNEPLAKPVMTLSDYVVFVKNYLEKLRIPSVYIIGHSFGGRVAVKLCNEHPQYVEKMIITGSPLLRTKFSLKKRAIRFIAKQGKTLLQGLPPFFYTKLQWGIYRFLGEWDYYKAKQLRPTFVNIINEDIAPYLPKIRIPVLLLWGSDDTLVSKTVGEMSAAKIQNARFIAMPHEGHGIPYHNPKKFAAIALHFLENNL